MLADGDSAKVNLHTTDGSTGYRIVKFETITNDPGAAAAESLIKIYSTRNDDVITPNSKIDFSDQTLLAVGYVAINSDNVGIMTKEIIFDNAVFNQDIYITCHDNKGSTACNYYFELEQIKLDAAENTVATIKDIRNIEGGLFPTV